MIVGTFAAIVCNEGRADAQNYPWCAEGSYKGGGTNCGFVTLQQCMETVRGGGPSSAGQIPCTSPRRDRMSWFGTRGTVLTNGRGFRVVGVQFVNGPRRGKRRVTAQQNER